MRLYEEPFDLEHKFEFKEPPPADVVFEFPSGLFKIETLPDGTVEITRTCETGTETRIFLAGVKMIRWDQGRVKE
jgi:hypothetical protein